VIPICPLNRQQLLPRLREFIALIGSDEEHAGSMLESINIEIVNDDGMQEDFYEICGPVGIKAGRTDRERRDGPPG
jgi:hypothetical protein